MSRAVGHNGINALRFPAWLRQDIPDMEKIRRTADILSAAGVYTVCEGAQCPNAGGCWEQGTATLMILGRRCSRRCLFCAVETGMPQDPDRDEPRRVALAVKELCLRYAVITSVTRDDLPDEGVGHFVRTIEHIRGQSPGIKIEVLIPDFSAREELLKRIVESCPDVAGHNIETVRRIFSYVRPSCDYDRSLEVLKLLKFFNPSLMIKSGFMVGLGETRDEVIETLNDLARVRCDMVTIGQYLAPSKCHASIERFVTPQEFDFYRQQGLAMGFKSVVSAPLARSSYLAEQGYTECRKNLKRPGGFDE